MYFRLNPESILTVGTKGSIICDAFENKIYHLDTNETELIIKAENNEKIEDSEEIYNILQNECLGKFYEKPPYILKIRVGSSFLSPDKELNFKKIYLEITNKCNLNCKYCSKMNFEVKRSLGCMGCNVFNNSSNSQLSLNKYYEIIDTVSNLGCETLHITGGDLSLEYSLTKKIISYSQTKFNNILISLSYKHDFYNFLNLLNENTHLILQINLKDFNSNIFIDENITYLVVVPENHETEFYNMAKKLSVKCIPDFLTFKNLNLNPNLNKNYEFDLETFYHNLEFHPCLGKTLFISVYGDVYPCPLYRSKKWGNINNNSFINFLDENKNKIYNFWTKNLDTINNCKSCEFRYICFDCRVLEEEISKKTNEKSLCKYNIG